jgi:hypothetical protein
MNRLIHTQLTTHKHSPYDRAVARDARDGMREVCKFHCAGSGAPA